MARGRKSGTKAVVKPEPRTVTNSQSAGADGICTGYGTETSAHRYGRRCRRGSSENHCHRAGGASGTCDD